MKKSHITLIVVILALIGVGVGLLIWVLTANRGLVKEIILSTDEMTTRKLEYSADNLLPGKSQEYMLSVHCSEDGDFSVSFSCENKGEGDLWKYLDIEITCGDNTKGISFSDFVAGETIDFDITVEKDVPIDFTICYKMPENVGNDAQRAQADFVLLFTAQRK